MNDSKTTTIYGCETWPMKKGHKSMLERTEMQMLRWMCGEKRKVVQF